MSCHTFVYPNRRRRHQSCPRFVTTGAVSGVSNDTRLTVRPEVRCVGRHISSASSPSVSFVHQRSPLTHLSVYVYLRDAAFPRENSFAAFLTNLLRPNVDR